jgi:hypothetical protein
MTTHAAAQIAIESRFDTLWTDQDVAVRFEEDRRKRPTTPFIRLSIRSVRSVPVGISGNKILYRRPAMISMQCFVPVGTGTQAARIIADTAIAIFEGQQFSGITCRESEVKELGDDGQGFWQVNGLVYFDFDNEVTLT